MRIGLSLTALFAVSFAAQAADSDADRPARVVVVVIYAGPNAGLTDPRLQPLAKEVGERDDRLKSFRIAASMQKSIPVGQSHTFALPDRQSLKVTVEVPDGKAGKICLTIEPPGGGEVTYSCTCNKFVPVVTSYTNSDHERMILAVMSKPCPGAGK